MPQIKENNSGRPAYVLAAVLLCAYAANVASGKAVASLYWHLPHAGDIAEFLTVLAAMISFVTGLLLDNEKAAPPD
ncbi:MAG: hypothetical protein ABIS45_05090 [Burkholderiales bacterium]